MSQSMRADTVSGIPTHSHSEGRFGDSISTGDASGLCIPNVAHTDASVRLLALSARRTLRRTPAPTLGVTDLIHEGWLAWQ